MEHKFAALESLGAADFEHKNGSLYTHLLATHELLRRWGASAALCDAGLYHSAYSTTGFTKTMVSLDLRSEIAAIIGKDAEAMVYLYCACDREVVYPSFRKQASVEFKDRFTNRVFVMSEQQASAFCELTVANELELMSLNDAYKAKHQVTLLELFDSMKKYLSKEAIEAYKSLLS
ncbi:MAG: hypothetical protein GY785_23000 [Gammaproteobacteria bacterium]|nr:hypothetical protein [Gammaproteobacteria bacterium]